MAGVSPAGQTGSECQAPGPEQTLQVAAGWGECSPTLPNVAQLCSGKERQSGGVGFLTYAERCTELVAAEGRPKRCWGSGPFPQSLHLQDRSVCTRSSQSIWYLFSVCLHKNKIEASLFVLWKILDILEFLFLRGLNDSPKKCPCQTLGLVAGMLVVCRDLLFLCFVVHCRGFPVLLGSVLAGQWPRRSGLVLIFSYVCTVFCEYSPLS